MGTVICLNDAGFAVIEAYAKKIRIFFYNPSGWYHIIQNSKRKNPFGVLENHWKKLLPTEKNRQVD